MGDRIRHSEPVFDRVHEGVVDQLLSAQFTYTTDDGHHRFCMFKPKYDDWEIINE